MDMTHIEMLDEFLHQGLKPGDQVSITMDTGEIVIGRLSDAKVHCEYGQNGETFNSRIGILPPHPPAGFVVAPIPNPFLSKNIVHIQKA